MRFPRFDFYPGDWLSDRRNAALTLEELGAHIQLLCLMWDSDDCSVPDDDQWVARQLRITVAKWRKLRAVLVDSPMAVLRREEIQGKSVLFSPKLREIFAENLARVEQARQAATARWCRREETPEAASILDDPHAVASPEHGDEHGVGICGTDADASFADMPTNNQQPASITQVKSPSPGDPPPSGGPGGAPSLPPNPLPPGDANPTTAAAEEPEADAVMTCWNRHAAGRLPTVLRLTPERRQKVRARCRDQPGRDLAWWDAYFARIAASPFCRGQNPRGWRATFDWAVRSEEVVVRVLEGVYDAPRPNGHARDSPATRFAANLAAIRQGMEEADDHDA